MTTEEKLPPRVLIVMPDQWTRALLRAALREVGYDAVGTRNVQSAMRVRVSDPARAPVRLLVVEQAAIDHPEQVIALVGRFHAAAILIARRTSATPSGPWQRIVFRPINVEEIVRVVEDAIPLPVERRNCVDESEKG